MLALVLLMWIVEVVDVALDHRLDRHGIEPRDVDGLDGIVAAPFLLEPQRGISWQGHLFGAIGGVAAARAVARERA